MLQIASFKSLVSESPHRRLHVDAQDVEDRVVHVGNIADLTFPGCLFDARIAPCRDRQTSVERLPEELRLGGPDLRADRRGFEVRLEGCPVASEEVFKVQRESRTIVARLPDTESIRSRMADRDQDRPRTCEVLSNEVQRERQPTLTELCNPLGCGQSNTGEGSSGFEGRPSPPWKNDSSSHAGRRTPPRGLALKAAHVDDRIAEWQSRHRPQLSGESPGGK